MNNVVKHTLRGRISWFVTEGTRIVKSSGGVFNNLILNQGLDYIAQYAFADCFNYCALGSGTNAPSKTDVGLTNETLRIGTVSLELDSNGAELVSNRFKIFRTFKSAPAESAVSYSEVGFSPIGVTGPNLFSKALFRTSSGEIVTVALEIGQTINVRYELTIELSDALRTNAGITNRSNSQGSSKIQKVGLKGISAEGLTENFDDAAGCNEPSLQASIFLSLEGTPPDLFNECIDRTLGSESFSGNLSIYNTGDYFRKKMALIKPSQLPDSWRSVGVGSPTSHGVVFVFNDAQNKEDDRAYLINFTYYWRKETSSQYLPWLYYEDLIYTANRLTKTNSHTYFAL